MKNKELILGVDVGGTGIKGGLVNIKTGELVTERHRIDTPSPATPKAVAATFKELVDFFEYAGPVGVGFPAIVRRGVALSAANISEKWIGTSIEAMFEKVSQGVKVAALNDADAAGLADFTYGAGKGHHHQKVVLLTFGTGIGSALFENGQLVPNTEFGHLYLKGMNKVAEKYVSNILRKSNDWPWPKFGKRLNEYLLHIERLLSPDLIIIGGGVSKHFEFFQEFIHVDCDVQPAQLLNAAGTVGAAMYAKSRF